MSNVDHAQQYAARGWHVFPLHWITSRGKCSCGKRCSSPGKHPYGKLVPEGYKDASIDPATIERWWAEVPEANIGIDTYRSGLSVFDMDGPEGRKEWEALGTPLPKTLVARTGRDEGYHFYYAGKTCPSSQVKGEHLDVRGTTGYVVAPPSNHASGRCYAWANARELPAPCPEWVEPWVRGRTGGAGKVVAEVRPASVVPEYLRSTMLPRLADRAAIGMTDPWSEHEEARLRAALACIPADLDGKTWFSHGAAIHDLNWPNGIDIWDDWSKTSKGQGAGKGEYKGRADIEKRWAKFGKEYKGQRVTVASIYAHAAKRGWDGEIPEPPKVYAEPLKSGINGHPSLPPEFVAKAAVFKDTNKKGKPLITCTNTRIAIEALGIACRKDVFHDRLEIGGHLIEQWQGEVSDSVVQMIRPLIRDQYGFDPGMAHANDAVMQLCLANQFHPIRDYLAPLQWDGRPRLSSWFADYLGAERTPLNGEFGRLALVAAVRRIRAPGAKFDEITVLEGPEGANKSTAIKIMAGETNFSDQPILTLDDRAQQEALRGVWLYEIADLTGITRADVDRVKAFASRSVDRARPAYGRHRIDAPRQCVFFGTTNNDRYLQSQTGNRRFWPVRTGIIRLTQLERDRDQLWAEACHLERGAGSVRLGAEHWGAAGALQDARLESDPWEDTLRSIISTEKNTHPKTDGTGVEMRVKTTEIFQGTLHMTPDRLHIGHTKRLAYLMRQLGWDGPKVFWIGAASYRGYTKPCA